MLFKVFGMFLFLVCFYPLESTASPIILGVDRLFSPEYASLLKDKTLGVITNHTAITGNLTRDLDVFPMHAAKFQYKLKAFFAPEHGLQGSGSAEQWIENSSLKGIQVYSLYGSTRRPTKEMLQDIDLLIYDIQDIGSRSYTYISTLFYVMEEAARHGIPMVVLDRPNPINGITIDGPVLEEKWRSFVGYLNIPYCHGMTIGELALYFNTEYSIGCRLTVIPMKGWKREMSFNETGLTWVPTSPQIPNAETAYYYPTTGVLGELQIVNIGIGYTLPFKVIGAPWIDAVQFAKKLNEQNFPGVAFLPFYYRPFFGAFAKQECAGVLISITDKKAFLPVTTQYLLMGMLKSMYPKQFKESLEKKEKRQQMFNQVNGTAAVYQILKEEKYPLWKLRDLHKEERASFMKRRRPYLIADYS